MRYLCNKYDGGVWCFVFLHLVVVDMHSDGDGYVMYYSQAIQVNTWIYYLYYYKNVHNVCRVDIYDTAMKLVKTHSENTRDGIVSWVNKCVNKAIAGHTHL